MNEYEMTLWDYKKARDKVSIINPKHINNMPSEYRERATEILQNIINDVDLILIQIEHE